MAGLPGGLFPSSLRSENVRQSRRCSADSRPRVALWSARASPPERSAAKPHSKHRLGHPSADAKTTGFPPVHVRAEESKRSEEHTSELQSHLNLVCRLLLEKKKITQKTTICSSD